MIHDGGDIALASIARHQRRVRCPPDPGREIPVAKRNQFFPAQIIQRDLHPPHLPISGERHFSGAADAFGDELFF